MVVGPLRVVRCAVVGGLVARCAVVSGRVARWIVGFHAVGSVQVARCVQDVICVRCVMLWWFKSLVVQELRNRCAMRVALW